VKPVLEGDDAEAAFAAAERVLERELHRPVVRFGPGVRKEGPRQAALGEPRDSFGERDTEMTEITARAVNELAGLLANGRDDARMTMTDGAHPGARLQIDIGLAAVVAHGRAAALDDDWPRRDGRDQEGTAVVQRKQGYSHAWRNP
jgi:hypothetical protein